MTDLSNAMGDTAMPNTPAQEAFIQAQHDAWLEEKTWPIWDVVITGDETEWVPRADARYWQDDENGNWTPKSADELPDDAKLNENGNVVRTARGTVTCHARNEDHAKMIALRDNTDYHTVESVTMRESDEA